MTEKCSMCKREGRRGRIQTDGTTTWFCTFHYNRMIQNNRMLRRLKRARTRCLGKQ